MCLAVFAISLTALCGRLYGHPVLYDWGTSLGMAAPTSICFMLLSVGLFLVARED